MVTDITRDVRHDKFSPSLLEKKDVLDSTSLIRNRKF